MSDVHPDSQQPALVGKRQAAKNLECAGLAARPGRHRFTQAGRFRAREAARQLGAGFAVRTCDHHHVPVRVAYPDLSMAGGRVEVRLQDDLGMK
jgi:hypothetical protein